MSDSKRPIILNTALQISDFEREPAHAFVEALRTHAELFEFQQQLSDTINKTGSTAESLNRGLAELKELTSTVCDTYLIRIQREIERLAKEHRKLILEKDRQIAELVDTVKAQKLQVEQLISLANKKKWPF